MSTKLDNYSTGGSKKDFGRVDDGTYPGRSVQVVILGRHKETDWKTGQVKTYDDGNPVIQPKVFITWELPDETIEINGEEKPRWYSKEFTISTNEKANLPKIMAALDAGNDLANALNKPCLVNIGSTSTGKAKVTGVTKVPKGMPVGDLVNEPRLFDPYDPDMETWEKLPAFLQKKIKEAEDFEEMKLASLLAVSIESDNSEEEDDEEMF